MRKEANELAGQINFVRAIEVLSFTKNIALIIEVDNQGKLSRALYRPEKGVRLAVDPRIPIPFELYHDCAYSKLDTILGFKVSTTVQPFTIKPGDNGVIRPYYEQVEVKPHYYFESIPVDDYWLRVSLLDYLTGLVDRTYNDILFLPNGDRKVIDNGLSFVDGLEPVGQQSLIRERLRGLPIPAHLLKRLKALQLGDLEKMRPYLYNADEALDWVTQRRDLLLSRQVVL